MSYRNTVTLEFSEIQTACLSGKNGAGKSALLDAMTWAIWGKTRGRSDREVISIGEDFMEVTFEFRIGVREFQVFRRRTAGNRLTLHFYSRQAGSPDFGMVSGDSVRETQQRIDGTLKIDYDTFVNSAFLMQGKADSFTQMRPGERKQVLGEILNLGDYDALARVARQRKNSSTTRLSTLQEQIAQADSRLETRPTIEKLLADLEAEQQVIAKDLATHRVSLQSLANQLQTFELLEDARTKTRQKILDEKDERNKLQQRISGNQARLAKLKSTLAREAEIRSAAEAYRKWRATADECAEALRKRQPFEEKLSLTRRKLDNLENQLNRDIDREREKAERARTLLDEMAEELKTILKLESESTIAIATLAKMTSAINEIESLTEQRAQLQAMNENVAARAEEIKEAIEALQHGDAICPVCRKPFGKDDHKRIEAEWQRDLEAARENYRQNAKQLALINKKFEDGNATKKSRDALQSEENLRQAMLVRSKKHVEKKSEVEKDYAVANRTFQELTRTKSNQSFATAERAVITEVERSLAELRYDADLHNESRKQLHLLQLAEQDLSELEQARLQAGNLEEAISELTDRLETQNSEIEELEQEHALFAAQLEEAPTVREQHQHIRKLVEEFEYRFSTVQSGIGGAQNQLSQLTDLAEERRQLKQTHEQIAQEADAYEELGIAFGINGIQAMVIENILPELQDDANLLLQRMSSSHLHVNFRTTRQAVTNDQITETLDIIIRDEAGERPYDLYSGGEAFRINFAIRIALSKLLVRRAGATIDLLIIDEGFGTQDTQGRDGLVEALKSIQDYFEMILVITHIEDIRDQFDSRIDVLKTDSGSQVTVN